MSQPPSFTLYCVPQINTSAASNTTVYQVSGSLCLRPVLIVRFALASTEDTPLETILHQFGINVQTFPPYRVVNHLQPGKEYLAHTAYRHRLKSCATAFSLSSPRVPRSL